MTNKTLLGFENTVTNLFIQHGFLTGTKKKWISRLIKGFIAPPAVLSQREIISPLSTKSAIFNKNKGKYMQVYSENEDIQDKSDNP